MSKVLHEKILNTSNINLILFSFAIFSVLTARFYLFPNVTTDYTVFLSQWANHLIVYGFNFEETFSNYNFPYLYLLWFGTLFTHDSLIIVKIIGLLSDLFLATGIYFFVKSFTKNSFKAKIAFLVTLIVPEILVNSSLWGQSDSLYTAFIVWSLFYFQNRKPYLGWLLIGIAFSFKLQTIFVIPAALIWFMWNKHSIKTLLPAIGAFVALLIPAFVAGRSVDKLLYAYTTQITANNAGITTNIPNIAVFINNSNFTGARSAMTFLALAVVCVIVLIALKFQSSLMEDKLALVKMSSIFALILPFILPNMLDRYFFVASMLLLLLSFIDYRYISLALAIQCINIISYTPYLSETILDSKGTFPVISYPILTVIMLGIIVMTVWLHYKDKIRETVN